MADLTNCMGNFIGMFNKWVTFFADPKGIVSGRLAR